MKNLITTTGIVTKIIDLTTFKVKLKDDTEILATVSSHITLGFPIYLGEEVPINMSPYDKVRGRINTRHWKRNENDVEI